MGTRTIFYVKLQDQLQAMACLHGCFTPLPWIITSLCNSLLIVKAFSLEDDTDLC